MNRNPDPPNFGCLWVHMSASYYDFYKMEYNNGRVRDQIIWITDAKLSVGVFFDIEMCLFKDRAHHFLVHRSNTGRSTPRQNGPVSTAERSLSETYFAGGQQPVVGPISQPQGPQPQGPQPRGQQQQPQGPPEPNTTTDKLNDAFLRIVSLVENSPNGVWCSR